MQSRAEPGVVLPPPPLPERRTRTGPFSPFDLFRYVHSAFQWLFGLASMLVGLAIVAAIPGLQFLTLGYLVEVGGRVARTGRIRSAFVGIRPAAKLGGMVAGCWLFLLPVRFVSGMAESAEVIAPGSAMASAWRTGLFVLIGLTFLHLLTATARGGSLRYYFWPFNIFWFVAQIVRGGYYRRSRDEVWQFLVNMRLGYYFRLGLMAFAGGLIWLVIPVSLLALGQSRSPAAGVAAFIGGLLTAAVLLYLPFLQLRMAMTGRFSSMFNVLEIRRQYRHAPWAFSFAFVITLLFAVPLYLLKIETIPKETAWLPSLVFIAFIYPARLAAGWAMGRAARRLFPRHWFFRVTGRIPFLPVAAVYVLFVFLSQYTSWNGIWSLYEQHAFLLPVPFVGM